MTVSGGIYIFVAFVNIRVKCLIRRRNFRVYVAWEFVLNRGILARYRDFLTESGSALHNTD